jgi:hypothetical protein
MSFSIGRGWKRRRRSGSGWKEFGGLAGLDVVQVLRLRAAPFAQDDEFWVIEKGEARDEWATRFLLGAAD